MPTFRKSRKVGQPQLSMVPTTIKGGPAPKAVELIPDSPELAMSLGRVLLRAHDDEAAVTELEGDSAKWPAFWQFDLLREIIYDRTNRLPEAIKECEKVLAVLPEQYGTNLLLGRVLIRSGNPEAALPRLMKAALLRPQAPDPHISLADAYAKLGRNDEAQRERDVGQRLAENGPVPGRPE